MATTRAARRLRSSNRLQGKLLVAVDVVAPDRSRQLNLRLLPFAQYLLLDAMARQTRAPFRKIAFSFYEERPGHKPLAMEALQVCDASTVVPQGLLRADAPYAEFRAATATALMLGVDLVARDIGWRDEGMVAAIRAMDARPDLIECIVCRTASSGAGRTADLRYRAYDDHIEVVLRVEDDTSGAREFRVASTAPGEPIPYMSNWLPVASLRFTPTGAGVVLVDNRRQVLQEVPLDQS